MELSKADDSDYDYNYDHALVIPDTIFILIPLNDTGDDDDLVDSKICFSVANGFAVNC